MTPRDGPWAFSGARAVALVTGGGARVGRAVCLELARRGCDVLLTCRSALDKAEQTAEELRRAGATASIIRMDLADLPSVERAAALLTDTLPRLDILVHNASTYAPTPIGTLNAPGVLGDYCVNAAAPLLLSQSLAPRLSTSEMSAGGAIVALADMHVMGRPRRDFASYAMSKAALVEMVRTLAVALAPRVRVNAVAPGVVAFPDSGHESDPSAQSRYLSRVPLGRSGTPEEAAEAVAWLALDAAYVTGEIVRVDGGRWLA